MNHRARARVASRLHAAALLCVVLFAPLVFYFTTEGTWDVRKQRDQGGWSGGYYLAQAEAIVSWRLDVPREAIWSECFERKGRCYGYFGVTPSLLRLPSLPLLRRIGSSLTPLYVGIAVLLAYWAALALVRRSLVEFGDPERSSVATYGYFALATLALGPGGTLVFLTRPAVYEEAAAWGIAFLLLAIGQVWNWCRSGDRRSLTLAIVFAILSANARLTTAPAFVVLGLLVMTLSWIGSKRIVAAGLWLALLPALTTMGVFWLKFQTPVPDLRLNEQVPEAPHWRAVLQRNGNRTASLAFLPTEVVAYFRPDALRRRTLWPYFDFPYPRNPVLWLPPLPPEGLYVERHTSLTATMPLQWLLNAGLVVWLLASLRRGSRVMSGQDRVFSSGLMLAAVAMTVLTLTTMGITNRYLADFFPISVIGLTFASVFLLPALRPRPWLAAAAVLVAICATAWSIVVTLSLNTRLVLM